MTRKELEEIRDEIREFFKKLRDERRVDCQCSDYGLFIVPVDWSCEGLTLECV
jgi:hypothetical protein